MPETSDAPVTTDQLTASLAAVAVGPYADASTAAAAELAAETIRYLNHAAAKGGITDPATIAAVTSSLATAAYRLPQLMNTISEWLRAETTAGRIANDHRRSPDQLTARTRAAITQTADSADGLAAALAAVHNLTATLHTAGPAAPAV
jgi:prephenate dehydratase